jgi:hypothetical protein
MFKIESCKKVSNRHWIVNVATGEKVHCEHNYDQAEYICKSMNREAQK